jgi:hypothetical protein
LEAVYDRMLVIDDENLDCHALVALRLEESTS